MKALHGYRKFYRGTQPQYNYPPYASTQKRCPTQPLVMPMQTLSELTGPVFGHDDVKASDGDLTRQHKGDPIGERIIVSGRVLDENGKAIPNTLVEIWQANSTGRYRHKTDQHDAPLSKRDTSASAPARSGGENAGTRRGVTAGVRQKSNTAPLWRTWSARAAIFFLDQTCWTRRLGNARPCRS